MKFLSNREIMSVKLGLIFVCGLFAVSVRADVHPAATILQQALAEGAPDLPLALRASAMIYKAMALDALEEKENNAIVPIWKSIVKTLTNPKGVETFRLAMRKIKDIISDDNAQQTLINIFATLYTCLTYDVGESGVSFPYKELRKMIYSDNKKVFPMIGDRIWDMATNPNTSEKFKAIVNSGEDTFEEVEVEVLSQKLPRSASGYQKSPRDVDNFAEDELMNFAGANSDGTLAKTLQKSSVELDD